MKPARIRLAVPVVAAAMLSAVTARAEKETTEEAGTRPAAGAESHLWAKIHVGGPWARNKVMRKGYLAEIIRKVEKHHPKYAALLEDALKKNNAATRKSGGCWANLRLFLANLAVGAVRPAGISLAEPMGPVLKAFKEAPPRIWKARGRRAIMAEIRKAAPQLDKAKPWFKRHVNVAIKWLTRPCNLWAQRARAEERQTPAQKSRDEKR